jgi:hypothetical protein
MVAFRRAGTPPVVPGPPSAAIRPEFVHGTWTSESMASSWRGPSSPLRRRGGQKREAVVSCAAGSSRLFGISVIS